MEPAPCPRQAPSQTRSLVLRPPLGLGSPLRWGLELGGLVISSKVTEGEVAEPSRAQASQAHRLLAFRRLGVCPEAGESPPAGNNRKQNPLTSPAGFRPLPRRTPGALDCERKTGRFLPRVLG